MRMRCVVGLACALALLPSLAASALAQGVQTSVLTGTVTTNDGATLPGATVTAQSPAVQGVPSTTTDVNGVYSFPGLPPGTYTVKFEMDGMSGVQRTARVPLGGAVTMDQELSDGVDRLISIEAELSDKLASTRAAIRRVSHLRKEKPSG